MLLEWDEIIARMKLQRFKKNIGYHCLIYSKCEISSSTSASHLTLPSLTKQSSTLIQVLWWLKNDMVFRELVKRESSSIRMRRPWATMTICSWVEWASSWMTGRARCAHSDGLSPPGALATTRPTNISVNITTNLKSPPPPTHGRLVQEAWNRHRRIFQMTFRAIHCWTRMKQKGIGVGNEWRFEVPANIVSSNICVLQVPGWVWECE